MSIMGCLQHSTTLSTEALHRPSTVASLHHAPSSLSSLIALASPSHSRAFLNLRTKKEIRLQVKPRLNRVLASGTNPSKGSDDSKVSGSSEGPPFLTILAGLVVFLFFCWIIGSIVVWLIGLIAHPPSE